MSSAEWRKENPARYKESRDKWRRANQERINELARMRRRENPEKGRKYANEWNKKNKDRHLENKRNFYKNHKTELLEKTRRNKFKKEYGITLEQYTAMSESQGNACAICGSVNGNGNRLCVDHDHATGMVRALLCIKCNVAIGLFGDNPKCLMDAVRYLEHFQELIDARNSI